MEAPTDAEIIERLRMADQEAMEMGRRVGPGNWANISAMALAYALKTEDPEAVVSENLERVGLIVKHYGPTRPGWGDLPASDEASAMQTDSDVRIHLLMQAQDYLESLVDGYFQSFGPGREAEAVAGIGNHINVGTAAACMRCRLRQGAVRVRGQGRVHAALNIKTDGSIIRCTRPHKRRIVNSTQYIQLIRCLFDNSIEIGLVITY